ncbi:MAG: 4,5-dioxygenase [Oligoflexus sp.]|nr:4,5-dioxygenase [Oligoflexus sp.]
MKFKDSSKGIVEYHAHVYFQDSTRTSAEALHEKIGEVFGDRIHRNSIANGPRGPHVQNMFGLDIPKAQFEELLGFLLLNHGRHSILFHPVTDNELLDHTHHALWLGQPQALELSCFA